MSSKTTLEFAPKEILCLLDLSPVTVNVLRWAALFAQRFGARIKVLHVIMPPVPRPQAQQDEGEALLAEFELRRNELRRSIDVLVEQTIGRSLPYEAGVGVGHPVQVVLEHIKQLRPGLIVLGGHGHDGMVRSLLGSVAENVVRESAFPTLVVKGPDLASGQSRLGSLLCPVDLTRFAAACVRVSAELAGDFGSKLEILRVLPDRSADHGEAERELREWVPSIVKQSCPVSEAVHYGDVAEQIVMYARQSVNDLVVVGAEHRRFLEFTVIGRTTERVVRHAPCSVLLLCLEASMN